MSTKSLVSSLGKSILLLVVGGFVGYFGGEVITKNQTLPPSIDVPIEILEQNKKTIDSLIIEIREKEMFIDKLKDSVVVEKDIHIKEINKVRSLPVDSAALFLTIKLREYEENNY